MDRATKERGPCEKQRLDILQYRPNNGGQYSVYYMAELSL
jgi:hypothetical protein